MILAHLEGRNGDPMRVDHVVNRGGWFGKSWIVYVGMGFEGLSYLVEADCESDAIDELTDSKHGRVIKTDDHCDVCELQEKMMPEHRCYDDCSCSFAGNFGERVNLDNVAIYRVARVEWFAVDTEKVARLAWEAAYNARREAATVSA